MPLSWHGQISTVLDCVLRREPKSVLDIGCGYGLYGAALRQYLPDATLVGVDAQPPEDMLGLGVYDRTISRPWPEASVRLVGEQFDLALLVDVIEHMTIDQGVASIEAAMGLSRALVIATPHDPLRWPQDDLPNPYERHIARWDLDLLFRFAGSGRPIAEAHRLAESIVVVVEQ